MKALLLAGALGCAAQLTTGCKHDADVQPASTSTSYDVLAKGTGHWEWESSAFGFARARTPATVGFTRQLVFGTGNVLNVKRSGQQYYKTSYQLSTRTSPTTSEPLITYTNETDLYNNDTKTYALSQPNGRHVLVLMGEQVPVDGGAVETYHWVAE
ncbi:hypothetical protein [Hymenobacter sp. PAMC 26628]|uniref:hypothetical protein n=1 Tax=Hymenobacter sp. PAMC 26628 TaxID=1484118 RepID=UPI000770112B|nr:hypothetical protein [Hymenobacter sp. PAMC 26628]AMJ65468.1 hypothetical protein AXW84_08535 [Hymenobacter sp. PAMC 26628]